MKRKDNMRHAFEVKTKKAKEPKWNEEYRRTVCMRQGESTYLNSGETEKENPRTRFSQ